MTCTWSSRSWRCRNLDVFERGIASKLDFSFSGLQAGRLANLAGAGRISIGAIHTYLNCSAATSSI